MRLMASVVPVMVGLYMGAYSGGGGGGVSTVGTFGSSPDAKGATISGSTLTIQPADATHPGAVTTGTQTLAGAKTFSSALTSSVGSGSSGFALSTNGARVDLGTGSTDFLASDGSSVYVGSASAPGVGDLYARIAGLTRLDLLNGGSAGAREQSTASNQLQIFGLQGNGAGAVSVFVDTNGAFSTSGTAIMEWDNNGVKKAIIDKDGTFNNTAGSGNITTAGNVNSSGGTFTAVGGDPLPQVHHTQTTSAVAIEFGSQALSTGAATVTFATAFGSAPICVCQDATAILGTQCSTSASQLTISGTGSDSVKWICLGAK